MSQAEKTTAAIGARTARACNSCVRRRARWYCAADDAFLCQSCDNSVHSANPLARRHHRVRLNTASFRPSLSNEDDPMWHHGVQRKARTPRHNKHASKDGGGEHVRTWPLVPDLDECSLVVEEEEQLIFRVPEFDPVLTDFRSMQTGPHELGKPVVVESGGEGVNGFLGSDVEMAEFALDVERLLGHGLEENSFSMVDELGLAGGDDCGNTCHLDFSEGEGRIVKKEERMEDEDLAFAGGNAELNFSNDTIDINFGCCSPGTGEGDGREEKKAKKIMLKLDYEGVIDAWSMQGCPWADGVRPQFDPNDSWLDNMVTMWNGGGGREIGPVAGGGMHVGISPQPDVGREARVSRYREKRRTRLFSKKIRYEVRKLNAEKRPRMKGRFVKRTSFAATTTVQVQPPFVY